MPLNFAQCLLKKCKNLYQPSWTRSSVSYLVSFAVGNDFVRAVSVVNVARVRRHTQPQHFIFETNGAERGPASVGQGQVDAATARFQAANVLPAFVQVDLETTARKKHSVQRSDLKKRQESFIFSIYIALLLPLGHKNAA